MDSQSAGVRGVIFSVCCIHPGRRLPNGMERFRVPLWMLHVTRRPCSWLPIISQEGRTELKVRRGDLAHDSLLKGD